MKKSIYFFLPIFVLASLCFGMSVARAAGPIELKAVSYFPKNHPIMSPTTHEWFRMLNEGLEGTAHIKYVGGPEAIPAREQIEAVRNNVVQIIYLPTAIYKAVIPQAASMVLVRFNNAVEMRKSAYHDFLVERHEKAGVRYLGPGLWAQFHMWSAKPIKKIGDLKGLKMRSFFLYDRFQKALGIAPVTIAIPELYTALERGVVDGFCFPQVGPRESGWTKKVQYIIAHPFYANDVFLLMNLATWNKLPKSAQDKIDEITANKYEPYMTAYAEDLAKKEWGLLAKAGVKKVTFPPEVAKKFVDTAYRVRWEELGEELSADVIQKLKKLTGN